VKKFLIGLRSIGILLGVWLLLAGVALVAGVFPSVPSHSSGSGHAADTDAGSAVHDAGVNGDPVVATTADGATAAPADAGLATGDLSHDASADTPSSPSSEAGLAARIRVCAGDVFEPVLVAADVLSSGAQELLIGCGDSFSLLSVEADGAQTRVSRVARFTLSDAPPGAEARARDVAAGDIDMDGRVDLLFGFVLLRPGQGGPQGGALDWVGRDPNSGFTPGHRLAPIAASRVMLADIDGNPGADPVALNATDPHGRRLSEVWVFSGGASPQRLGKPSVGRGGLDFALLDLDADGHVDLAALSYEDPKLTLFFGDGAGAFEGLTALSLSAGSRLTVGPPQANDAGPGSQDLLVSGGGWFRVAPGVREELTPRPEIFAEPERANQLQGLARVHAAGDLRMVGLSGHDVVSPVFAVGGASATLRVMRSFPASFLPVAFTTGELDARRGVDMAVLGRGTAPDAPLELVILSNAFLDSHGASANEAAMPHDLSVSLAPALSPLKDAPLSLRVALP